MAAAAVAVPTKTFLFRRGPTGGSPSLKRLRRLLFSLPSVAVCRCSTPAYVLWRAEAPLLALSSRTNLPIEERGQETEIGKDVAESGVEGVAALHEPHGVEEAVYGPGS